MGRGTFSFPGIILEGDLPNGKSLAFRAPLIGNNSAVRAGIAAFAWSVYQSALCGEIAEELGVEPLPIPRLNGDCLKPSDYVSTKVVEANSAVPRLVACDTKRALEDLAMMSATGK